MVLLLLTGGAIINVAVAWGCALIPRFSVRSHDVPPQDVQRTWFRYAPADWPQTAPRMAFTDFNDPSNGRAEVCRELSRIGFSEIDLRIIETKQIGSSFWVVGEARAGLPLESLRGGIYRATIPGLFTQQTIKEVQSFTVNIGPLPVTGGPDIRRIPIRPVWPGFAINTIFYAAILWLLVAAPGFVRRRIRARRGQCPACAYPIGASDVCTECGKPVRVVR